jgi:membrane protein DedA with SNARE-associated domain
MPGLIAQYGLVVVALIIFTGEIGLPTLVPGEIALLLAGSQLVHSWTALVAAALLFGTVDLVATSTIHVAARTGGNRLLRRALRLLQRDEEQHEEVIASWRRRLRGRDPLVVFVTRLIPVFRFYASITTGLIRIRIKDFLSGAAPAALLWAATPLALGYALRGEIAGIEGEYGVMIRVCIVGTRPGVSGGSRHTSCAGCARSPASPWWQASPSGCFRPRWSQAPGMQERSICRCPRLPPGPVSCARSR